MSTKSTFIINFFRTLGQYLLREVRREISARADGILEYLSLSNDNTSYISPQDKFKFIDDLSILEKINLLYIGLSSYNFKGNVASDIVKNGYFLPPENLETQSNLDKIAEWTRENKMMLNISKTKAMNINFTNNFQFSTRLSVDNQVI